MCDPTASCSDVDPTCCPCYNRKTDCAPLTEPVVFDGSTPCETAARQDGAVIGDFGLASESACPGQVRSLLDAWKTANGLGGHDWVYNVTEANGCTQVDGSVTSYNAYHGAVVAVATDATLDACFYSLAPNGSDPQTLGALIDHWSLAIDGTS